MPSVQYCPFCGSLNIQQRQKDELYKCNSCGFIINIIPLMNTKR